MSDSYTEETIQELKCAFEKVDKDGDGEISLDDLGGFLHSMGLTTVTIGELKQMIRDVDAEGNGKIGFSEFVTLMARSTNGADAEAELKEVFSVFDKRGQKKIGVEDLKAVFLSLGEKLTDEEIQQMIREVSTKSDKEIDFEEFVRLMS